VAAGILQNPKNVVIAFMHILHLKKMCARLHWLAVLLLALHGCTVVYAVLWLLPFAYKAAVYVLVG
jgi:hypothetical protein